MGLILSLETTTTNCSVALGENGTLLALLEDNSEHYSHNEKLHLFIQDILKSQKYRVEDLDAVAVSQGPGSYTGLRIGVSAAKGLCFAQGLPLIAIDTLESLMRQSLNNNYTFYIPMLDARRMEVYTATFNYRGEKITGTEAKVLEHSSFDTILDHNSALFMGNGSKKFEAICQNENAHFEETRPSAREMVSLAEYKFKNNLTEDLAYFEPVYLKDFMVKK